MCIKWLHSGAAEASLGLQAEVVQELLIVFYPWQRASMFSTVACRAFNSTIDDHGRCTECIIQSLFLITRVRNVHPCGDLVDAWLWRLWWHIKPDGGEECYVAVFLDKIWFLKKLCCISSHRSRELSIVVVPAELEGSTAIVLLASGRRPYFGRPARCSTLIVTVPIV